MARSSHLRQAIFGPSSLGLFKLEVAHLTPKTANRHHPTWLLYYFNLLTRGPSMAHLLNVAWAIFGPLGICK